MSYKIVLFGYLMTQYKIEIISEMNNHWEENIEMIKSNI